MQRSSALVRRLDRARANGLSHARPAVSASIALVTRSASLIASLPSQSPHGTGSVLNRFVLAGHELALQSFDRHLDADDARINLSMNERGASPTDHGTERRAS